MFLFTEAHFWSSTKSCKRKLHSYSPVLLLLSNPLLHWSRSKTLSQRHFFYWIFRGGAEGPKCHTSPAHSPTNSPLLTTGDAHWPQNTSKTGQQWNTLLAGKPSCLPQKMKPDLPKAGNKAVETLLSANPREPLSAEEKLPSSRLHRHIPGAESRNHTFASQTGTQEPLPCLLLIFSTMPRRWRVGQHLRAWIISDHQKVALPAPWDQQAVSSFST